MTASQFIQIPAVGGCPEHLFDPDNRAHVASLIERADAMFRLSAKTWIRGNNSRNAETLKRCDALHIKHAENGEALLSPLGIKCDWPGLYPSFTVNGYAEHDTKSAVLAALGKPRNWLQPATA